jgi:hypothetical protein
MLDFLVTSKARRRLLLLLWSEGASGSASELAERAGVGFASAYRELQAMRRRELVVCERRQAALVFSANHGHPLGSALRALLAHPPVQPADRAGESTRARLAALGAPVMAKRSPKPRGPVEESLVAGVALAHKDPAVARALPVAFYRQRDRLDPARLVAAARAHSEKAAVGFYLDLTAQLCGDRRFSAWAKPLRDRRVHTRRPFFYTRAALLQAEGQADHSPAVAHRWGFRLGMTLGDFQSLFDKVQRAS